MLIFDILLLFWHFSREILHEMDTRHTYEPFLQLIGVSRGYNLVDIDFRWCIGIYVWKWGSGASIIGVGSGQLQKNGEKCSKIGSSKNSKKQQNIENRRNAPTYRYIVSLLEVSGVCNLVGVASRWYMKVVLSNWSSRIPIGWFDRGQLPKNAKNRSKSDLIVCVEKIRVSRETWWCRHYEYFQNPGDRRVFLCVTGTVWGIVPKHQVTGEKHSILKNKLHTTNVCKLCWPYYYIIE